jgi:hypothetical protein
MTFICNPCNAKQHEHCRGNTWCDCQHKEGK